MDCAEGLVLLAEEVSGIVGSVLFQQPMSSHLVPLLLQESSHLVPLLLQESSHLVSLLLQESSHLVTLLLQESSLHFLSFFVKTFLVYLFPLLF